MHFYHAQAVQAGSPPDPGKNMTDKRTEEIRDRLDNDLSIKQFKRDYRSTGEAATQYFQDLFVELLNFDETTSPLGDATYQDLPVHDWSDSAKANAARLFAKSGNFRVVYVELKKLTRTAERNSIQNLTRSDQTKGWAIKGSFLTVFHAPDKEVWHLVTPYEEGTDDITSGRPVLRRYTLGEGETHRTVAKALSKMDASKRRLSERVEEAFRVKPVTEDFYENYKSAFDTLSKELRRKGLEIEDADRYAHTTLNRLMFFYYVQKKGWIGNRKDFVRWFHEQYEKSGEEDIFHQKWLSALFFEGMNSPEDEEIEADLPGDIESAITKLPYMNGGLFQPTDEDKKDTFLSDYALKSVIEEFLEQYNFTVTEESPYDIDVAVDPAMLGKIYESLIAEQERGEAGIFYTPRVEVDLMCRGAVYEQLTNQTQLTAETVTYLLFADRGEFEKSTLSDQNLEDLKGALQELKVVDPACGSGAFLIGMLHVLGDIHRKLGETLDYDHKKQIVEQNIHGVDIKEWAVRVAEFRLWLSLVEDVDEIPSTRPVLPNFGFKLRVGDSIVQGAGSGISLDSLDRSSSDIVRKRLPELKKLKQAFYQGKTSDPNKVLDLQQELITNHINQLIEDLRESSQQSTLSGSVTEESDHSNEHRINRLEAVKERLREASGAFFWDLDFADVMLEGGFDIVVGNPPYVEQSEIIPQHFSQERLETFDEDHKEELKEEYKSRLREYVEESFGHSPAKSSDLYVYFFYRGIDVLRNDGTLTYVTSNAWLDVKYGSDLQGKMLELSDVNYVFDNRNQRTFEEADINTIISVLQRDSSGLGGETLFSAFYRPYESCVEPEIIGDIFQGTPAGAQYNLQFAGEQLDVSINNHFRDLTVGQADLWRLGGGETSQMGTLDGEKTASATPSGTYSDGKWGRFLRAPDIYFKILDEAQEHLTTVGELAEIERGFTTGANKFFYLPKPGGENRHFKGEFDQQTGELLLTPKDDDRRTRFKNQGFDIGDPMFRIEKEYWMHEVNPEDVPETALTYESSGQIWVPNYVVKSPKEIETLSVKPDMLSFVVLLVDGAKDTLQSNVTQYIEWGEQYEPSRYGVYAERKTCAGRNPWYRLDPKQAKIFWIKSTNEEHYTPFSKLPLYVDQRMYMLEPESGIDLSLAAVMNSHLVSLVKEVEGRLNMGEGVLDTAVYEVPEYPVVDVSMLTQQQRDALADHVQGMDAEVTDVWEELGTRAYDEVELESVRPDRRELDSVLLTDILGLSSDDQREIYRGLLQLVHERLHKAQSV